MMLNSSIRSRYAVARRIPNGSTITAMTLARSYTPYHPGLLTDLYHPDSAYVAWRAGRTRADHLRPVRPPRAVRRRVPAGRRPRDGARVRAQLSPTPTRTSPSCRRSATTTRRSSSTCSDLRFSGEILAMPEGSIAFPNEPLLRVTAPFDEALLLESGLLQAINLATLIATKASRVVWAARGRPVAEFSLRRAQDPFVATRSSRIGGCFSTSFLGAAFRFRLPSTGTVPHALIQLFDTEQRGLRSDRRDLQSLHPAARHVRSARGDPYRRRGRALGARSARPRPGRRSASTAATWLSDARYVRDVLDRAGSGAKSKSPLRATSTSSRSPSCWTLARRSIRSASAPAWASARARSSATSKAPRWAASTRRCSASTSAAGTPRSKSPATRAPGRASKRSIASAISRRTSIQLADEPKPPGSERLLKPVVLDGEVVPGSLPPLSEIWEFAQSNLRRLPDEYRQLVPPTPYPVHISDGICAACATAPSPSSAARTTSRLAERGEHEPDRAGRARRHTSRTWS